MKSFKFLLKISGLSINKEKSEVLFCSNTPRKFQKFLTGAFMVKCVQTMGQYLDTFIDGPTQRKDNFQDILQRFTKKLKGWKGKLLS